MSAPTQTAQLHQRLRALAEELHECQQAAARLEASRGRGALDGARLLGESLDAVVRAGCALGMVRR